MYTTPNKEFILFPCSGSQLNEGRIFSPCANLKEKDAALFSDLLTECTYFSEVQRFSDIIFDDDGARKFLKEFFSELKSANSDMDVYVNRKPMKIPFIKSIHIHLSKTFSQ